MSINRLTFISDLRLIFGLADEGTSWLQLSVLLALSALAGLAVFAVCRVYYGDIPHERPISGSLIPATVLTTLIYYQNSMLPGLSILMIGILAFIHYRSVIKDMNDVAFVFWAVLTGLLIGAELTWPVLAANIILAGMVLIWLQMRSRRQGYLLLIRYNPEAAADVKKSLDAMQAEIITRTEKNGMIDLAVEIKLCYVRLELVDALTAMDLVESAVLVSRDKIKRDFKGNQGG